MIERFEQHEGELIALVALMMSLGALSIDAVLPALPAMADTFGVRSGNTIQLVITVLILGLTIGQLVYGPVSDRIGRRRAMLVGVVVFVAGSLATLLAEGFAPLLVGRFLQGFGVAAMRIVPLAIVRDRYQGAAMARIMSLALAVFILVPCVAPMLGQGILLLAGWRAIFWSLVLMSGGLAIWFWLRQPETLDPANRVAAGIVPILEGLRATCTNRQTLGHTIGMGLIQGAHVGYVLSAEQIFHHVYQAGDLFAVYFALGAVSIGVASVLNAQIVERLGMERVSRFALLGAIAASGLAVGFGETGIVTLAGFLAWLAAVVFFFGLMLGNMNAIALQPLGHIAGLANSAISFISGMSAVGIGSAIGAAFDRTVLPLMWGVLTINVLTLAVMVWADRQQGRLDPPRRDGAPQPP